MRYIWIIASDTVLNGVSPVQESGYIRNPPHLLTKRSIVFHDTSNVNQYANISQGISDLKHCKLSHNTNYYTRK
jgi:hypothetical protein